MTKWEYKFVTTYGADMRSEAIVILNEHGSLGWEVASELRIGDMLRYLLKRPLPQTIELGRTMADRQADAALLAKTKEANHEG